MIRGQGSAPMKPTPKPSAKKEKELTLSTPLQFMKGVGPAKAAAFERKGITTLQDALYYFPRRYEDRRRLCTPRDLVSLSEGTQVTAVARIERHREIPLRGKHQSMFEVVAMGDQGDLLTLTWFRAFPGMREKYPIGAWAVFQGALKKFKGAPQIVHPDIDILRAKPAEGAPYVSHSLHWGRVVPIYSRSEKLSQKFIRETLFTCLERGLPIVPDLLPEELRARLALPELSAALKEMHFPAEMPNLSAVTTDQLSPALRRLIFEEFFKFQLVLLMDRAGITPEPARPIVPKGHLAQKMRKNIPYTLTNAQERAIAAVLEDIQRPVAMNRIVQGDVGSGKTFVALFSAAEAIENGGQVAFMAPTEILAEQHYQGAKKLFEGTGVEVVLLTGSLKRAEKEAAQSLVRDGKASLVIGTHALIQEAVGWKNLVMAIIDEQHRFGVKQRRALKEKAPVGTFPHILTMTATPIPRSLALTVFGELDVTTIDELPPGRQEILTKIIRGSERERLYGLLHREAAEKRQGYIVYPLVADSEKEGMEKLKSVEAEFKRLAAGPLKGLRLAMVHGKMDSEERNAIMRAFKNHEYDVLISTTVIEVGVDVPNATVMAIENAERFGLSQLHQLRGRVGRGAHKSFCVLVTESAPPGAKQQTFSEAEEEGVEEESPWVRLMVLEKSRSGFDISEHDLKIRGPGDFFGTKQSGSPSFRLADLQRDGALLAQAREEAMKLHARDPGLQAAEHSNLNAWFRKALEDAATTLKSG
ncbi:MAG: ATP-dependent DNA helicase RecG [Proteobacteria bacterium]|nr:MAG: ATP-dependent DNA helicase RecG [Pseudomonadota bacterium]